LERIMVDTSAIYALLDGSDSMHGQAVLFFNELSKKQVTIVVTNFMVAECHALLANRLGSEIARAWLEGLCWPIERVTEEDENRAREIIATYADKSFTYCDAAAFAVMERLEINRALAFDQHFIQYGFTLYNPA